MIEQNNNPFHGGFLAGYTDDNQQQTLFGSFTTMQPNSTQPFPTEPLKCVHSSSLFDIPCHKGGNNCGLLMVKQQIIILSDIWRNADGQEEEEERLNSLCLYSKVKVVLTDKIIIHIVTQHQ